MAGHSHAKNIMHRKGAQDARRARQFANMPRDTIERAVKKATGAGGGEDYAEVRYEGYGPAGVAVIVEALTDNRNRTASDVRSAFSKFGGALGETNSVSFMFARVGVVTYRPEAASDDAMLEAAIDAGADDVVRDEDGHQVICGTDTLFAVRDALEQRFGAPEAARFDWRPSTTVALDEDRATSVLKLIDALEENDDVQTVFANYDIPEAVLTRLAG